MASRDPELQNASPTRRVLVLAPQPFYQDRGTPIALRHVLEALSKLGIHADVLTFPGGADVVLSGLSVKRVRNLFGIRQVPIGFSLRKLVLDLQLAVQVRHRLEHHASDYDGIHAVEEAAFLALVMGKRYGLPVIYDMQSSLPEQLRKRWAFRAGPVQKVLHSCERWLLERADLVVCSAGLEEHVRQVAPAARVREWRFPVRFDAGTAAEGAAVRRDLGIPVGVPVILYSGTFESYQGLSPLLRAIPMVRAEVPAAVFVMVGCHGNAGDAVVREARGLGLNGEALHILPRQPRSHMAAFLAMADVLVSPRSAGGNLPLKIYDYLAAGRPIVATDLPVHRPVLAPSRAVLVGPTPELIAQGIIQVIQNPLQAKSLAKAARTYARKNFGEEMFVGWVDALYRELFGRSKVPRKPERTTSFQRVSVVIPARNEAASIRQTLDAVRKQAYPGTEIELIVVDDGSTDATAAIARECGAQVVLCLSSGNPGAARNRGAAASTGDPIVFLDADCVPGDGWLQALLAAHADGATVVGGSLALPPGLPFSARCDYYGSAFHVHPRRPPGLTPNHPPANVSALRSAFHATAGFTERGPVADGHEELAWQAELRRAGHTIRFEPRAIVFHYNRPGLANLLRRNYRWAYSSIESKASSGAVRHAWLYRHPRLLTLASIPLTLVQLVYIIGCWLRAGIAEPLLMLPGLMLGRLAYAAGTTVGGFRWLQRRPDDHVEHRPRWR